MKATTIALFVAINGTATHLLCAAIPGSGYEYAYNAGSNLLPDDTGGTQPAWNYYFGSPEYTSSATLMGGTLQINAPEQQYLIYRMGGGAPGSDGQSWNPVLSLGSTIEFKAQAIGGNQLHALTVYTEENQFIFTFGTSEISTFIFGDTATASYENTGGFHTYQINLTTDNTADVYIDGVYGFTANGSGVGSSNRLEFGNGNEALNGGVVNYEYIQWTNAGVRPIPEPSSVLMLISAVGCFAGYRSLRR